MNLWSSFYFSFLIFYKNFVIIIIESKGKEKVKMKVIDFLKVFDGFLPVIYYPNDSEMAIWDGSLFDTPWWVANMPLVNVDYREKFKDNKPGLVITVEEE